MAAKNSKIALVQAIRIAAEKNLFLTTGSCRLLKKCSIRIRRMTIAQIGYL